MRLELILAFVFLLAALLAQGYAAYKIHREGKRLLFEFLYPPVAVFVIFSFVLNLPKFLEVVALVYLLLSLNMVVYIYMGRKVPESQNYQKDAPKNKMGILYIMLLQLFGAALYLGYYMYVLKKLNSDPLEMPYLAASIYLAISLILFPFSLRRLGIMVYDNKFTRVTMPAPIVLIISLVFAPLILLYHRFWGTESSDRIDESIDMEKAIEANKSGVTFTLIGIFIALFYCFAYYILVAHVLKSCIFQMPYLLSTIYFAVCFFLFIPSERILSVVFYENKILRKIMIPLHVMTISFVFAPFVILYRIILRKNKS